MVEKSKDYAVKDLKLAKDGQNLIHWAEDHMPVLMRIRKDFEKRKPLKGFTLGCCLHVTKETGVLAKTLKAGGAKVALCASNPLSTNDSVAAALAKEGILMYAWRGVNTEEYYWCVDKVLDHKPNITMDDGSDLVTQLHTKRTEGLKHVIAGTEETTTGVNRQRIMAEKGDLKYPIIAVNDAMTKHFFDNRYGTGQSTIDGILRATSVLLSGKTFVVSGYGWCGKGVSMRARGMGANVIITEVDPVRALEAVMDGFRVMPIEKAANIGDIFVTVTGNKHVIDSKVIDKLKNGVIVSNSGHFDNEINVTYLDKIKKDYLEIRPNVREYHTKDGRTIYLLSQGRLVNLSAAEGHPSEVMDMSFANQSLVAEYLTNKNNIKKLEKKVYSVPVEIDQKIALHKLKSMNIEVDALSKTQKEYMDNWQEGT
ncbi:adenosylhomocysteinase [Thermoplasmatales archaeon SG8-52-4]|nr:MAG: adenosylhomocysteinase [Thermoplasmatales archaeon SG8-52-4]